MDRPQLAVRYRIKRRPGGRIINLFQPVAWQILGIERLEFLGQPGFGVDAIRNMPNRRLRNRRVGPEELPHLPADFPMQFADPIGIRAEANRQHGHTVLWPPGQFLAGKTDKTLAIDA